MSIEIVKRASRAVRVDVAVVKSEWQQFIAQ